MGTIHATVNYFVPKWRCQYSLVHCELLSYFVACTSSAGYALTMQRNANFLINSVCCLLFCVCTLNQFAFSRSRVVPMEQLGDEGIAVDICLFIDGWCACFAISACLWTSILDAMANWDIFTGAIRSPGIFTGHNQHNAKKANRIQDSRLLLHHSPLNIQSSFAFEPHLFRLLVRRRPLRRNDVLDPFARRRCVRQRLEASAVTPCFANKKRQTPDASTWNMIEVGNGIKAVHVKQRCAGCRFPFAHIRSLGACCDNLFSVIFHLISGLVLGFISIFYFAFLYLFWARAHIRNSGSCVSHFCGIETVLYWFSVLRMLMMMCLIRIYGGMETLRRHTTRNKKIIIMNRTNNNNNSARENSRRS